MQYIPQCYQFRDTRVIKRVAYEEFVTRKKKSVLQLQNEENLRKNRPSGVITRTIKLKMNRILYNWILSVQSTNEKKKSGNQIYFTFITLTLPASQMHTDKELHRLALNSFIIKIKRKFRVKNYMWRAEKQKNGNLHYHIIVDRYIYWELVRAEWNTILNRLGYIEKFKEKNHHDNPNSTDIHGIRKVKNLCKYVSKYVTKNSDESKIDGRVWGCSDEIKNLKDPVLIEDQNLLSLEDVLKKDPSTKYICTDYCEIFYNNNLKEIISKFNYINNELDKSYKKNFKIAYKQSLKEFMQKKITWQPYYLDNAQSCNKNYFMPELF